MDILDGIINTILGPDTSQMSEEDRRKTEAGRARIRLKRQSTHSMRAMTPGVSSCVRRLQLEPASPSWTR
jgi:hypothetical protein